MDASTTTKASYQQPVLFGGLVMGVLSALPLISLGNACCCLWVVTGGLVASFVLQQNQATPISPGDGAIVGLLAGLAGAVVAVIVSIPVDLMMAPVTQALMERVIERNADLPPDLRDFLQGFGRGEAGVAGFLFRQVVSLVAYVIAGGVFSTLGGLLGSVIFSRRVPPPPVSDARFS